MTLYVRHVDGGPPPGDARFIPLIFRQPIWPFVFVTILALPLATTTFAVPHELATNTDTASYIENPETPSQAPLAFELKERWRLESEAPDGELVFGAIGDVEWDTFGNIYLADYALNTIHVLAHDGRYLRSLAAHGEGPGEVLSVEDCFLTEEGSIGIIEYNRQRITFLTADGHPADTWTPAGFGQLHVRPLQAQQHGSSFVVACRMLEPSGNQAVLHEFLGQFTSTGELLFKYVAFSHLLDRTQDLRFDEESLNGQRCFVVAANGDVFLSPSFLEYSVLHFNAAGTLLNRFGRTYDHFKRPQAEKDRMQTIIQAEYANYRNAIAVASDYERDIMQLNIHDNALWIETSQGWLSNPPGVALTMDIFDFGGHFKRQARFLGTIDSWEDSFALGDSCAILITQNVASQAASIAAKASYSEDSLALNNIDAQIVICFDLVPVCAEDSPWRSR